MKSNDISNLGQDSTAACELEPRYLKVPSSTTQRNSHVEVDGSNGRDFLKAWIRRACAMAAMNRPKEAIEVLKEVGGRQGLERQH